MRRGEFLRLTAGALVAARLPRQVLAANADEARIAGAIAEYDRQGIHRTATPTDDQSAQWLAELAGQAGASATLEPFTLDRVDVVSAYVEAEGRRADALPLFDGTFTDEHGIVGPLGLADTSPALALVTLNASGVSSEGQAIAELRRSTKIRGIVAVTEGSHAGLSPTNAAAFSAPYGSPVLQVSSADGAWLADLARRRQEVRFVADARRTSARASNVIARVGGRQPDLAPIVVMTPRSGWWQCAAERGGGLACWLEIARAAAQGAARRPLLLVASSGHELGHFGLEAFIASRPGLIKAAAAWIHLGANIGATGGGARLQASDDQIEELANAALTRAGARVQPPVPRGTVPGGEARNIHVGGGRYLSLLGSSPFFHNAADRWPAAVDVPAVARFARAFADVAATLATR
jgi:hypothetical protein